jgi:hypothetical protein
VTHHSSRHAESRVLVLAEAGSPELVVISGVGGCGTSAWALQWAHSVRRHFGDGQFVVDFRGSSDRSVPVELRIIVERLLCLGRTAA